MNHESETDALTALGHPGRLAVFRLLARRAPAGVRPGEIAAALDLRPNTLSVYLATLVRAGLARSERSGKAVHYRVDLARTADLVRFLVADCCRGRPELCAPLAARHLAQLDRRKPAMAERPLNVLFICTGNSARSIIAESILNHEAGGRFRAYSAGTRPAGAPNPLALAVLRAHGHDVSGLHSKDLGEFEIAGAPAMDFIFTVCDHAANEECPAWPGQPTTAHWGLPDPAQATGTDAERSLAFQETYRALHRRLGAFAALPLHALDAISLQQRLDALGRNDIAIEDEAS